jgi:hypothetical protein
LHKGKILKNLMALASGFYAPNELWLLTHNHQKNQDGFSLRFFNSKGAMGFNPQPLKNKWL